MCVYGTLQRHRIQWSPSFPTNSRCDILQVRARSQQGSPGHHRGDTNHSVNSHLWQPRSSNEHQQALHESLTDACTRGRHNTCMPPPTQKEQYRIHTTMDQRPSRRQYTCQRTGLWRKDQPSNGSHGKTRVQGREYHRTPTVWRERSNATNQREMDHNQLPRSYTWRNNE